MTELFDRFFALMETRRSLRDYSGPAVTEQEKDAILQAGHLAPTAGNMSLYSVIQIENQEIKKEIAQLNEQPFIASSSFVVLYLADWQRWYDFYVHSQAEGMCRAHNIPWRVPQESELLLAASDALIAAQTAVIAAESMGIGSCYFGTAIEGWERTRDLLQLPPLAFPVVLTAFGHWPSSARPAARQRLPLSMVRHVDSYRRISPKELELMENSGRRWSITAIGEPAKNVGQKMYLRKTGAAFAVESARATKEAIAAWLSGTSK